MAEPEPPWGKIFPRNLTARAEHAVRGNPAGSRPESGVDNCYPGLEFDQRTLDTAFFPGLSLEFHRPDGALLAAVGPTGPGAEQGLRDADLPLYLWALCGRTTVDQDDAGAPTFTCTGLNGLDVWRRVHDLLPGTIAVLLGPVPGISSPGSDPVDGSLNGFRQQGRSLVQRDEVGAVQAAVLVADRARYLGSDGPVATEGSWLVTAVPPDAARFVTAGRRRMITTEAPLAPTADPHTCSMATGRQAWAFLAPIGPRRALVQAMVPRPVHDPVRLLGHLLHETGLGAQLAGSPATATVVPAAPQLLAPPCGPGWLAVGAAAVQFDPLSGSGAAQAVRTAILAAAAIEAIERGALGPAGPRALRRPTPRGLHRPSPPLPQPVPIGVPRCAVAGRTRRHRAHAESDRSPYSPDGLRAGRAPTRTATSGCAPGSSTCPTEPLPVTH